MSRVRMATFPLIVLFAAGCASSQSRALDRATDEVQKYAAKAHSQFQAILQDRYGGDINDVLATELGAINVYSNSVITSSIQPGNRIRLDVNFVALGGAGGGMDYETAIVRLCVRYEGPVGGTAEISDIDCPANLPVDIPNLGKVISVVKLTD